MRLLRHRSRGQAVRRLQGILREQGFYGGALNGRFDKHTLSAVVHFQETHLGPDGAPLDVDGFVGPATWWALENPSGEAQSSAVPTVIPKGLTPLREKQLEIVLREKMLGVKEKPDGSNRGERIDVYTGLEGKKSSRKGPPWCCLFWSWADRECFGEYSLGKREASCYRAHKKAKELGLWREKGEASPIPGDAFVMLYRNKKGRLNFRGHIGFVLRVEKDEDGKAIRINTVEGNAGNRLKTSTRKLSDPNIAGFINPFPADEQSEDFELGLVKAKDGAKDNTR